MSPKQRPPKANPNPRPDDLAWIHAFRREKEAREKMNAAMEIAALQAGAQVYTQGNHILSPEDERAYLETFMEPEPAPEETKPQGKAPPDPHAPLTPPEREVWNLIRKQKPGTGIMGKEILAKLAKRGRLIEESDLRGRIIPRLMATHGVKNRRGVGYYPPPKIRATKTQH